jgi:hypothetical protein
MSTPWAEDDLLEDLRAAFREMGPVPPEVISAGKAAFELRNLDFELALLTYDSERDPELAGAFRGHGLAVRRMVFSLGGTSIDVDVLADSLVGQISPAISGRVVLETRDGRSTFAEVDEEGMFTVALTRPAEIRLRVEPADRRPFGTEWARV